MYVLQKYGIQNDFANIIKVLYKGTECRIKLNDKTTEWFPTYAGVRQGQNDSTTLFAMFVNSIADKINTLGMGVKIGTTSISILMYADDIVLLSETENGLQMMLNELYTWCNKWRMKLNTKKTQVMHFRVKRKIKTKQEFYFGPNKLETVDDYKYLGVKFNEYLDKQVPGDSLADGATRSLGKLLSKYH